MKMEAVAMIRRGWPNEGALDRSEVIKASTTLVNGDWVVKDSDNTVIKATTTNLNPTAVAGAIVGGAACGLVVVGNGDAASAANANKAVVLWSGYIADISNLVSFTSVVPGSILTVKTANPGQLVLGVLGTDPVVATVLDVVAASATETAHVTVMVK